MLETNEVAKAVERRIAARRRRPVALKVSEKGIHEFDGCWYVPVLTRSVPRETFPYFEYLADIETDLLLKDDLNVFLLPGTPDPPTRRRGASARSGPSAKPKRANRARA